MNSRKRLLEILAIILGIVLAPQDLIPQGLHQPLVFGIADEHLLPLWRPFYHFRHRPATPNSGVRTHFYRFAELDLQAIAVANFRANPSGDG